MAKRPKPRWNNGRLDPDWLGTAGLAFVREWLSNRLAGRDPYQPIDVRVSEDPDAFVVGLLREVGAGHPASEVIARAVLQLLDEARKAAPQTPDYFRHLLRMCQQVRLPQASSWFVQELDALARDVGRHNRSEAHWGGYKTTSEIVYAAVVQCPGYAGAACRPAWERLLEEPRYVTVAFMALSRTFSDQVEHLGKWWARCNVDERERELEQILLSAVENEGEDRAGAVLRAHASSLPTALKRAIDETLGRFGYRSAFVSARPGARAVASAIEGAGLRREFVLARQQRAGAAQGHAAI